MVRTTLVHFNLDRPSSAKLFTNIFWNQIKKSLCFYHGYHRSRQQHYVRHPTS